MQVNVKPGTYVIAVSGGVDSVVLLDLLRKRKDLNLIVAHFDHGIRDSSHLDEKFVSQLAKNYGLNFESKREDLGTNASEELSRRRRYEFLNTIKTKYSATSIITAHHYDDVLETALINLLRGTGRRGISSLKDSEGIKRPLLKYSKIEILYYARDNNLTWREDHTNQHEKFLRNKLRKLLASNQTIKEQLSEIVERASKLNNEIDEILRDIMSYSVSTDSKSLDRRLIIAMPYSVSAELVVFWLRENRVYLERSNIENLIVAIKTSRPVTKLDIGKGRKLAINRDNISLEDA